jgi:hypothetical protein
LSSGKCPPTLLNLLPRWLPRKWKLFFRPVGREIESRQGIGWYVVKKLFSCGNHGSVFISLYICCLPMLAR